MRASEDRPYLPAMIIGELQAGVEVMRSQDAARAEAIEAWIDQAAGTLALGVRVLDTFRR